MPISPTCSPMLLVAACAALASCSPSPGTMSSDDGGGEDAGNGDGGSGAATLSKVSVRIANTFLDGANPVNLDIYDDFAAQGSVSKKPLLANVQWGTASPYAIAHYQPAGSGVVALTALPAGSPANDRTDAVEIWADQIDQAPLQITLLLDGKRDPTLSGALAAISTSQYVEKGDDGKGSKGPLAPTPPAGKGEFLASTDPIDFLLSPTDLFYFFVDNSCVPPLNGDPSVTDLPYLFAAQGASPMSAFALFPSDAGAAQIAVVDWPPGPTATCQELMAAKQQGGESITIATGQQVIAFVYGTSVTDLHLLTAPVAP